VKHWDLIPHETVTLIRGGVGIRAGFLSRDTRRARFVIDEQTTAELFLRDDGDLEEHVRVELGRDKNRRMVFQTSKRVWRILGERPDSRGVACAEGA
jgi:hypothetical protein